MSESVKTDIDLNEYPHINRGLEGIVAFSSNKSSIDGQKGELIYSGYNIETLAENSSFEEVCFLLWNDRLPSQEELEEVTKKLQQHRSLPDPVKDYIRNTDKEGNPMTVLRSAVSMLEDYYEDQNGELLDNAIAIAAKMPTIVAAFDRARKDQEIIEPLTDHSMAHNFLYMLNGEHPGEQASKTMDLALILHAEHGMNASTFTCRTICSTESDMFSAVTGAIGALKGPLHGGANQEVMKMLLNFDEDPEHADPADFVKSKLERKEKVMGFGHRVYKVLDPRAVLLRQMAEDLSKETGHENLYEWSQTIVQTMHEEKDIDPNVDFYSATVYYSMGIPIDMFTCIFAMSRVAGWTGHYIEQAENNRLIRPRALYMGEKNKAWTSIEER